MLGKKVMLLLIIVFTLFTLNTIPAKITTGKATIGENQCFNFHKGVVSRLVSIPFNNMTFKWIYQDNGATTFSGSSTEIITNRTGVKELKLILFGIMVLSIFVVLIKIVKTPMVKNQESEK